MDKLQKKILLVDDETDILEFLSYNLKKEGYRVYTADDGYKGIELARKKLPDLIVLDLMMPGKDGVEVCRELRKEALFNKTLIVFLTARDEEISEITGFEVGADDFITKPIRPKVFTARINALLKRSGTNHTSTKKITLGDIIINPEKRAVTKDGVQIDLPKKEFDLLALLASTPGKVFSRDEIYMELWGNQIFVGDRTLDVHIRKLREKIGAKYIITSKGIGYKADF
ncbi:MAG: response regulator transcription factor [Flavobacteriales bacterium]|nr:response regulator transcription factor [Flavobacteriales bacterium]